MAVFQTTFACDSLWRSIDLNVIIPFESPGRPDLAPLKPAKFKTLYLLHGFGGNRNDWMNYTPLRDIAERNNIAIVLPEAENSFYVDSVSLPFQYGKLIREIVDFTRRAFPLSDKREDTFIGGLSMGGFGALRVGSLYHDVFSKVFSFSGAFIIDDIADQQPGYQDLIANYDYYVRTFGDLSKVKGSEKDPLWCLDQAIAAGEAPAIYQACGTEDFLYQENLGMKAALEARPVSYEYHEMPGIHDWVFWNKNLEPAILWLLKENE